MSELGQRLKAFMDSKRINNKQLADCLGVNPVAISKWINQDNSFGMESLRKCLVQFPDLNARWLILGEGEMLDKAKEYSITKDVASMVAEEMKKYGLSKPQDGKCG